MQRPRLRRPRAHPPSFVVGVAVGKQPTSSFEVLGGVAALTFCGRETWQMLVNTEVQTLSQTLPVWPAAVVLGSKVDDWTTGNQRQVEFVALSPAGKPMANVPIEVRGAFQGSISYRQRTVGGFYSYQQERRSDPFKTLCQGRSDAQGRYTCRFSPKMDEVDSGSYNIQATATEIGRAHV